VLLAGLCVSSLTGAVLSLLLLATAATGDAAPALAWLLGGIVPDDWRQIGGAACVLALLLGFAVVAARDIDALSLGDDAAHALGVSSRAVLAGVIIATTLATAMAVSLAGLVGFVGGLVPIAMRSMVASGSRSCVPACALVGGASLALLDAAARTVLWPVELPTGVLAGCIGAPLVLLVIRGEAAVRARL
jgi:iron complex transport system permease protein